jgi:prepilin-type N-terminal cleavage/methylation domain-containing protein
MKTGQKGFTLTELIIVALLLGLVITAASSVFLNIYKNARQQGALSESNENVMGLQILRRDIEGAGYGLPWAVEIDGVSPTGNDWGQLSNYLEAASAASTVDPALFNDADAGGANDRAPRAILSGNDIGLNLSAGAGGSDYLVIKSVNVGRNATCERWTLLDTANTVRDWGSAAENLVNTDRVVVIAPGVSNARYLVTSAAAFFTTFNPATRAAFAPTGGTSVAHLVYGVDPNTNLRMPFNRADYFISNANVPKRCAPNTGVLVKGIVKHADGGLLTYPLFDCVADFQVVYRIDTNDDGIIDSTVSANINALADTNSNGIRDAEEIRKQLKEVRVYILTHEGQKDSSYTHSPTTVTVGEYGMGRDFNIGANINYRWKVYRLIIKPLNLS